MKLKISIILFFLISLSSCTLETNNIDLSNLSKNNEKTLDKNPNDKIIKNNSEKPNKSEKIEESKIIKNETKKQNNNIPIYFIGEAYDIDGVTYIPKENYDYVETGLASFYGPDLHRKKTANNEYNKVTELYARHKTLPLPSLVKITNLENGLSLIVRINDRGPENNSRIIEVSRKVAQLLRFYKSKIAKVKIEVLPYESKQLRTVIQSMSDPYFDETLAAVPTESVLITNLDNSDEKEDNLNNTYEQPVTLGYEELSPKDLFIKIIGFETYEDTQNLKKLIKETYKITTQKENEGYSIIFGPMLNQEADNLFQILVSKGYKHSEIIIK